MIFLQKDAPERVGCTRFADLDCWRCAKADTAEHNPNEGLLTSIVGGVQKNMIHTNPMMSGLLTSIVGGVQKLVG